MPTVSLETLPVRMQKLPRIERNGSEIPVPWFVDYLNGKPEFRAMDPEKFVQAIRKKLCWVCGERLGVNVCFVAGPMCGINRTTSEPPNHNECAVWSAINCPFLSNPNMVRREDDLLNNEKLVKAAAGMAITRNPGVTMLWYTREYQVFDDGKGQPLITMGPPQRVEWYREGRPATRAEVMESVDTGLPVLEYAARQQRGAMEQLQRHVERFMPLVPAV